jgi:hypothetical protein
VYAIFSRRFARLSFALTLAAATASPALSQTATLHFLAAANIPLAILPTEEAALALPDSPSTVSSAASSRAISSSTSADASEVDYAAAFQNFPPNTSATAGRYDKYIKPGQQVPHLSISDKFGLGVKDAVSPLSAIGWLLAAGYSQAVDSSPNYGSPDNDRSSIAFAQRFGAAAARAGSEGIFSDSVMAPIFHQDPRYYKMGSGHNVLKRAVYAATRPLITRTDGGHTTINLSYLGGNLAGAALTQAYYPPVNRGLSQVMQTYGGSIGGGALGFLTSEFLDDTLQALHLQKAR